MIEIRGTESEIGRKRELRKKIIGLRHLTDLTLKTSQATVLIVK